VHLCDGGRGERFSGESREQFIELLAVAALKAGTREIAREERFNVVWTQELNESTRNYSSLAPSP